MFVKSSLSEGLDAVVIHIPDSERYEFRRRILKGLYLILPDREILLRDKRRWTGDFRGIPEYAVEELYDAMLDEIAARLMGDEPVRGIDVDAIERVLLRDKFQADWLEKGYITDEDVEYMS